MNSDHRGGGRPPVPPGPLERGARWLETGRTALAIRWLLDNAVGGIVGAVAVFVAYRLLTWAFASPIIGIVITVVVIAVAAMLAWVGVRRSKQLTLTAERLLQLDATLLRLLSELQQQEDRTQAIPRILEGLLSDMTAALGEETAARSMVLRPVDGELRPVASYEMPKETLARRVFPLTPEPGHPRGVALAAFLDRKVQLVSFSKVDGAWRTEHPDFIHEGSPAGRTYRSFGAFPLIPRIGSKDGEPLGVLCVDSRREGDFRDSAEVGSLRLVASRLVAAIQLVEGMPSAEKQPGRRPRQERSI